MPNTTQWKVRVYLFEDERVTKARAVLDAGATQLTGHGAAHCNPEDVDVPEIGDELAAGRAMHDLGRQLVSAAEHDMEGMGSFAPGRGVRPVAGWRPV